MLLSLRGSLTHRGSVRSLRIRWRIFSFLFGFGLIAYVQQKSLTIAAARMMPDLGLSQLQIGWLEQAFVIGYTLFQLPGGLLGQRVGARVAFTVFGLVGFSAVIATPLVPEFSNGTGLLVALLLVQLVLGLSQGGIFPVSAGVFATWFPSRQWPLVQGLATMALSLGAAITPPLIASLMGLAGWQRALAWSSWPALVLVALWVWYARNTPREHPGVCAAELAELGDVAEASVDDRIGAGRLLALLTNRNTVFLTFSYVAMNYAFYLLSNWCFLYLIQERHFSLLESGWLAAAPPLAAALGAGIGGALTERCCERFGVKWGYRMVPLVSLPVAAALLVVAVFAGNPYAAVVALTACFACVELTEGAFWGTVMSIGRDDSMAIGGILNTGGNLGGIIGIPIVAYLSGRHSWAAAFVIGSMSAVAAGLLWFAIDANPLSPSREG
jgi:MFS transporter, ACS family, glucarate transporter